MAKYLKLGSKASTFFDPYSRLNISGNEVVELNPKQIKSDFVKKSLAGGHLSVATEAEFLKFKGIDKIPEKPKEKKEPGKFDDLTEEELQKYYEDNYQVTKAEIKAFAKLSQEDMVSELTKLEGE